MGNKKNSLGHGMTTRSKDTVTKVDSQHTHGGFMIEVLGKIEPARVTRVASQDDGGKGNVTLKRPRSDNDGNVTLKRPRSDNDGKVTLKRPQSDNDGNVTLKKSDNDTDEDDSDNDTDDDDSNNDADDDDSDNDTDDDNTSFADKLRDLNNMWAFGKVEVHDHCDATKCPAKSPGVDVLCHVTNCRALKAFQHIISCAKVELTAWFEVTATQADQTERIRTLVSSSSPQGLLQDAVSRAVAMHCLYLLESFSTDRSNHDSCTISEFIAVMNLTKQTTTRLAKAVALLGDTEREYSSLQDDALRREATIILYDKASACTRLSRYRPTGVRRDAFLQVFERIRKFTAEAPEVRYFTQSLLHEMVGRGMGGRHIAGA
jgi:hypothetical protein